MPQFYAVNNIVCDAFMVAGLVESWQNIFNASFFIFQVDFLLHTCITNLQVLIITSNKIIASDLTINQ